MKTLLRLVLLAVVAVFGLQLVASESGEVVVVRTFVDGPKDVRLWIVDEHGTSWLRAGSSDAGWYRRLLEEPDIVLERGGELYEYSAFPIEGGETVSHINALMLQKYGWAEEVIGLMIDRSESVAIRLDPR